MKKGERVETLTKVVGQPSRSGVVVGGRGDGEFVEVEWDDGRRSTVSTAAVVPVDTRRGTRAR